MAPSPLLAGFLAAGPSAGCGHRPTPHKILPQYSLHGAAGLLVVMLLPQVWQLFRSRHAGDLSHVFLGLFNFGAWGGR